MRTIGIPEIEDIALGAVLLGAGGGGWERQSAPKKNKKINHQRNIFWNLRKATGDLQA